VNGARLPDGRVLTADLVVTCAGDSPATDWLAGTGLVDTQGIAVDDRCRTRIPGVYAAGDVSYLPAGGRAPFWSNAVAQARVAACTILGLDAPCLPRDDYFGTEIIKLPLKVVGPLPVHGAPPASRAISRAATPCCVGTDRTEPRPSSPSASGAGRAPSRDGEEARPIQALTNWDC